MNSSEFHHYTRDEFLAEFYPDPADKAAIAAGIKRLRAEQRAFRLAEMRRRFPCGVAARALRAPMTRPAAHAIRQLPGHGTQTSAPRHPAANQHIHHQTIACRCRIRVFSAPRDCCLVAALRGQWTHNWSMSTGR